ncbi:type II toxin-antitoxin system RelE/ParE family toxin [Candidatus Methylospira mobilis]|uniref:Type II toxin-antitoxin system RelE/ParE family toxin n=1 Tax=Candidatus Methylospira mobilis TaxID=1808979 RepID=A0A5Q0BGB5_9GAMM|nr:type II toxin-antitoxin system RelE/ParE family toxin [Candidatus Methylospira mobilis]QFY42873.1 type II toxin-antitoxin system RelE/ParE family toxin [Candidatus Methylospira mobilis]WNV04069.1 type II toxin-antitoxin system RelE/ParE family toxin [Candidatus Methylospira mobilis]
MPQVIWSHEALDDLARLVNFLEEKSSPTAKKARKAIIEATKIIEQFPESGKIIYENPKTWEVYAEFGRSAYVVRYRVKANGNAVILRVWHGKENR